MRTVGERHDYGPQGSRLLRGIWLGIVIEALLFGVPFLLVAALFAGVFR